MIDLDISDAIATLTLNRPPVNGMSDEWVARFNAVLDELDRCDGWNVVLVRSALDVFCAGADLKQFRERFDLPIEAQLETGRAYQALFSRLEALPAVTIAEIGGPAFGGGLELALSCDLRIASSQAKLGLPEVGLGLLPGAGGTQRLTWLCGRPTASRLILGGEIVGAEEAARLGIIHWLAAPDALRDETLARMRRYAAMPKPAVAAAKAAIAAAARPGTDGFAVETEGVRTLLQSPQTRKLVAAFLEKSAPKPKP